MTKSRRAVLNLMREATSPLSAAELYRKAREGGAACDQATVYRTLHYLEDEGFAESFVLHCSEHGTERFYTPRTDEEGNPLAHKHWFHCEACHGFTDLGDCALRELASHYEAKYSLRIHAHTLYFTGLCASCKEGAPGANDGPLH